MESILLISGGMVSFFAGVVIWKKWKDKKRTEMLRIYEEMERRRHIQKLSINWNAFQESLEKNKSSKRSPKIDEMELGHPDPIKLSNALNKRNQKVNSSAI